MDAVVMFITIFCGIILDCRVPEVVTRQKGVTLFFECHSCLSSRIFTRLLKMYVSL